MVFVTSVAYEYYKSFCSAFIEINGQPETIFGKPPIKYVVPVINVIGAIEGFCFFLFALFVLIHLSNGDSLFFVVIPLYFFYGLMLTGMLVLFFWWSISMFKFARSILWIICFIIGVPMIFVNVILFFGVPLLVLILLPIQRSTNIWQTPTSWDCTFYIILSLFGGMIKAFIRPSEDEENPFSFQKSSWIVTISYFFWLFLFAVWIFLLSCNIDKQVPWVGWSFSISYWVIFIPFYFMVLLAITIFAVKAIIEWRLVIKHRDPNGDGLYKATFFSGLVLFCILMFIAGILTIIAADYQAIPFWSCMIPVCLAYIVIILISLMPFITLFQKKIAKGEKNRREMLTAF